VIAGLTGGIGSGKSTVAQLFEILGCPVFRSDEVAKQAYFQASVRKAVIELIGPEVYSDQATINRAYISQQVFSNTNLLHQLNSIIHPVVKRSFAQFAEENADKLMVKESALLFEAHLENESDRIIVVSSPDDLRIERIMKRDGISREDVLKRIKSQLPQEEKIKKADFVIVNDEKDSLIGQTLTVYRELCSIGNRKGNKTKKTDT
jgi:dephospho-CoA kinase